jgi:hypothetical protein
MKQSNKGINQGILLIGGVLIIFTCIVLFIFPWLSHPKLYLIFPFGVGVILLCLADK